MRLPKADNSPANRLGSLRCLDVEIDPSIPSIRRGGEEVDLRAKGLQVLLFLVENRHRVVSRDEILENSWPGIHVVDATLAGCIQEIRKALGDDAKDPRFIRTLPKLGYRFIAPAEYSAEPTPSPDAPAVADRDFSYSRKVAAACAVAGLIGIAAWVFSAERLRKPTVVYGMAEVAWWKLDERSGVTVTDASPSGLTGAATGGSWEAGRLDGGLRLDGARQQVYGVDEKNMLPSGDSPRSLAAWVKVESTNGDTTGIVHFGQPADVGVRDAFRLFLLADGRPAFAHQGYAGLGDDRSLATGGKINDGQWHHLAGTFDGSQGVLYLDGAPQSAVTMAVDAKSSGRKTRWAIGNHLGQIGTGFRGVIDDVRIWPRPLEAPEVAALHRCMTGEVDLKTNIGQPYYFSPVFQESPHKGVSLVNVRDGIIIHNGLDYGGIQLAARKAGCSTAKLRGADVGQDLKISVELLVPRAADGSVVQAGPYFRSRAAVPGDGIIGGSSAGYWVQLHSDGAVTVKCLNPSHTVAFSRPVAGFDDSRFHQLDVTAVGELLEAKLDGAPLIFDQAGKMTQLVSIPPDWERPTRIGRSHGTVGIAFSAEPLRRKSGGQQAKGLSVEPWLQPIPHSSTSSH